MDRIQIKNLSRQQIQPQLSTLIIMYLISYAIISACYILPGIGGLISTCLSVIFAMSMISIHIKISNNQTVDIKNLFDIFKNINICGNSIILVFLISIFTFLWSLLFIIPGIIKGFSYAMAPYILVENEYYMTPMDAIKESERIMQGHKMELFILSLSFIGWILLSIPTCGLLMFYVEPYMNMSFTNFYNQIKNEPEHE